MTSRICTASQGDRSIESQAANESRFGRKSNFRLYRTHPPRCISLVR